jgi:four helix bundle protein
MMEGPIKSYQDLRVWQLAMRLATEVYKVSGTFPRTEAFGMTSQMRRAAVSVAANIAEGHGRGSNGQFGNFLGIAQGSLKELETHILLSKRVGLLEGCATDKLLTQANDIGKMLGALIRRVAEFKTNNEQRTTNNSRSTS